MKGVCVLFNPRQALPEEWNKNWEELSGHDGTTLRERAKEKEMREKEKGCKDWPTDQLIDYLKSEQRNTKKVGVVFFLFLFF